MDAYEATRVVLSRIQALDPENAAKIMGFILIQDYGEKEMIRLAFGPESLLQSIVLKARVHLGIIPPSSSSQVLLSRQNSSSTLLSPPPPLTVSSPSWAPPASPFSKVNTCSDELQSPDGCAGGDLIDEVSFLNGELGWNHHRRSFSVADLAVDAAGGFGWRPCLYFARGYCKNGTSCRFLHGIPDDAGAMTKLESPVKNQRASQLMASAFPYSPTSSPKSMSFLFQPQSESPRVSAMRIESLVNPGSRQIYLTFPADSTFREEDVSNYFSIYGPVQDVRIPYQQKRMFGFVTFVYPETVKLILAKGNPHFVCDARVLVKPYKEKGKVPDKFRKDSREPYDLQHLVSPGSGRILYSSGSSNSTQEALMRRRLEEQQQAVELQQAIELQGRRFMGLQLLDLKSRSFSSHSNPTNQEQLPQLEEKQESSGEVGINEDCDFQERSDEHNLPDNPFASPTKDTHLMNIDTSNHLLTSSFNSCFFPVPRCVFIYIYTYLM
ncbi:CCCH zinc finger domain-containing protein [Dioscorea alata]|uniref:CCCH zinc finger domain-containing protein n=1 Tax=Dioscorea alata TaxID=55571 RepID=A0ACB7VF49_DIOAL|nr:CCCH zinc finger domain-containing protein [Dioscorea alata]